MKEQQTIQNADFSGLGIAPKLLEILDRLKFTHPTPIQLQSIPVAITGKDVIGIAQTGTGKTLAFGVPMLQRLVQTKGRGLIIVPTRELAMQVNESIQKIGSPIGLKTAIVIGGESSGRQIQELRKKPHIIIATPGRLIDHLNGKTANLADVKVLVLDEADRMLDMGFAPQIRKILAQVPKERQTMLFSATMPNEIVEIARAYMAIPVRVEVAPAGTTAKRVTQELFFVPKEQKLLMLGKVLADYSGSVLIFSRTKHGAKKINQAVQAMGHTSAEIHSNKSLNQRLAALDGFKKGRYKVLVATDIAARGIDVKGIELVINYDLPDNPDDYVHRIGRTARAERTGHAISFVTPDQRRDVRNIERLIKMTLPVSKTPELKGAAMPRHAAMRPAPRAERNVSHRTRGSKRPSRNSYWISKPKPTRRPPSQRVHVW